MIKRITVENFMAHKKTTLDLARGVTVITGPNNSGKSAIVEAIRSISQNPPSKAAIRHGERCAVVRIELDTGEVIGWERTDKTAIYRICKPGDEERPETYAKFGRTPPEDVRSLLRLDPVETETGPVDIHIGNQRYPIFLLDQSGSQAASFFAASTEAEYLLRMQQALKARTDQRKRKHKELSGECEKIEAELERLEPLEVLAAKIEESEKLYQDIRERANAMPILDASIGEIEDRILRHGIKARENSLLQTLHSPPELGETELFENTVRELQNRIGLLSELELTSGHLAGLQSPPEIRDTEELSGLIASLVPALDRRKKFKENLALFGRMTSPPPLGEVIELSRIFSGMDEAAGLLCSRTRRAEKLEHLVIPPVLHDLDDLSEISGSLAKLTAEWLVRSAEKEILGKTIQPPIPNDLDPLEAIIAQLRKRRLDAEDMASRSGILSRLGNPPEIHDAALLESLVREASALGAQADRSAKRKAICDAVALPPELLENRDLIETLKQIASFQHRIKDLEETDREDEARMIRKKEEIESLLGETGTCPFCGHLMDLAHFLDEVHG